MLVSCASLLALKVYWLDTMTDVDRDVEAVIDGG